MAKKEWYQKGKTYRHLIQLFFVILVAVLLMNFVPQKSFALTVLVLFIVITLTLRSGICGWICPLGALLDVIKSIGERIGRLPFIKPLNRKYTEIIDNNLELLNKIDKYARYFKYIFLVWIIIAATTSLSIGIKEEGQHGIVAVLPFLIVLAILGLFVKRAWCRYACPLGALVGVLAKLSPTIVTRDEEKCIDCGICSKNCTMNIDVAKQKYVKATDCATCLDCVDACPVEGALDLKVVLPKYRNEKAQVFDTASEQAVK